MPQFIDCDIRMYMNINIGEHNKTLKEKKRIIFNIGVKRRIYEEKKQQIYTFHLVSMFI